MNKNEVLELIEQRQEIARQISESELGKQSVKISEQINGLLNGYISLDQGNDPEAYDLKGAKVGDYIEVFESGYDGALAILTEVDDDWGNIEFEFLDGFHKGQTGSTTIDAGDLEPDDEEE